MISKKHCCIFLKKLENTETSQVFVEDCSSNGTFINGKLIGTEELMILQTGDELSLVVPRYI
jgi:hypothetical protein